MKNLIEDRRRVLLRYHEAEDEYSRALYRQQYEELTKKINRLRWSVLSIND